MKRRLIAAAIGLVMVGTMSTAAIAMAATDDDEGTSRSDRADKSDKADRGNPPPWARRGDDRRPDHPGRGGGKPDQAWKDVWKGMTPAERAEKMAEFAEKHAAGMRKFADCVSAARDDAEARAACERPLPPGLAKKQLKP